jgi:hypothetical protein
MTERFNETLDALLKVIIEGLVLVKSYGRSVISHNRPDKRFLHISYLMDCALKITRDQAQEAHAPFDTYLLNEHDDFIIGSILDYAKRFLSLHGAEVRDLDIDSNIEFDFGASFQDMIRLEDNQSPHDKWLAELELWWNESKMSLPYQSEPFQNLKYLQYLMIHGGLLWNGSHYPNVMPSKYSSDSITGEELYKEKCAVTYIFTEYSRITGMGLPCHSLDPPSSVEKVRMILDPTYHIIIWIGFNKTGGYRPSIWALQCPKYYKAFKASMESHGIQDIDVTEYPCIQEDNTAANDNASDDDEELPPLIMEEIGM